MQERKGIDTGTDVCPQPKARRQPEANDDQTVKIEIVGNLLDLPDDAIEATSQAYVDHCDARADFELSWGIKQSDWLGSIDVPLETKPRDIRVYAITPGLIDSLAHEPLKPPIYASKLRTRTQQIACKIWDTILDAEGADRVALAYCHNASETSQTFEHVVEEIRGFAAYSTLVVAWPLGDIWRKSSWQERIAELNAGRFKKVFAKLRKLMQKHLVKHVEETSLRLIPPVVVDVLDLCRSVIPSTAATSAEQTIHQLVTAVKRKGHFQSGTLTEARERYWQDGRRMVFFSLPNAAMFHPDVLLDRFVCDNGQSFMGIDEAVERFLPDVLPTKSQVQRARWFNREYYSLGLPPLSTYMGMLNLLNALGYTPESFSGRSVLEIGPGIGQFAKTALAFGAEQAYVLEKNAIFCSLLRDSDCYVIPFEIGQDLPPELDLPVFDEFWAKGVFNAYSFKDEAHIHEFLEWTTSLLAPDARAVWIVYNNPRAAKELNTSYDPVAVQEAAFEQNGWEKLAYPPPDFLTSAYQVNFLSDVRHALWARNVETPNWGQTVGRPQRPC